MLKIIECPRDAMQGIKEIISTENKVRYINQLLKVGFDTIDMGSFVSSKAIPQMADTRAVLDRINWQSYNSKLLTIVANVRGAREACEFEQVDYLGFPFSISETFQLRNTNSTMEESLERVREIQDLCLSRNKELVVYISMGFGNPYGDIWNAEIVQTWAKRLSDLGIKILSLSDTIGVSNPINISYIFSSLIKEFPDIEFGAHLHTTPHTWKEKIQAAYENGCRRFDGAIKGYGGCPMAKDELTGNMPTENMLYYFDLNDIETNIERKEFNKSLNLAMDIFPAHS